MQTGMVKSERVSERHKKVCNVTYESLRPIRPGRLLADSVYKQLSEGILRNELPPGTSLAVPELSRQLGISRSPIREAVQRLIHDGLADYRGRRGTVVSSIEIEDFVALLDVREILEGLSARLAARLGSTKQLDQLDRLHTSFWNRVPAPAEPDSIFVEHDMAFHRLIREMSRNSELDAILNRTQARAHLSMHSLWGRGHNVEAVQSEHHDISTAILARNPDLAASAAERHIAQLRRRTLLEVTDDDAPRPIPLATQD